MKKNNIIFIAVTAVFILTCIFAFAAVSGGKPKAPTVSYNSSQTQSQSSSSSSGNFFLTSTTADFSAAAYSTLPADNHFASQATSAFVPTSAYIPAVASPAPAQSENPTALIDEDVKDKMCVVTAMAADTWDNSDSGLFVPYLSTLAQGTMDYVTGTSKVNDSEDEKTRYFFNLASGRKVSQSAVSLVPKTEMGDNGISVVSSSANANGELTIVLSERWKVPYLFSYAPQGYYSSGSEKFCVNDFTATSISFTFYYTTSASGAVNTSGSSIVSSASWSSDPSAKTVTLTMPLFAQGKYYGHSASYDSNGNLIITINNKPKTMQGAVVMLDPGHGGKDSGSVSPGGGHEKDINYAVTWLVKSELEKKGATVLFTRNGDQYLSLDQRKERAYQSKPDVFVALHCDGAKNETSMGTSAYYFKPMSKALSQSIYNELVSAYMNDIYAGQPDKQKNVDRKCLFHPFSVTRMEECPAVLIEMGFVTNEEEYRVLCDTANQQKIAAAIANGIEKYMLSY